MLPDSIPHFSVGPFSGLAVNAILAILCLIVLPLYPHYRPLRSLFLFYLSIALAFFGWVVYGLQKSPESILLGNRILYASLSFLPAIWFWFYLSLFNEKPSWLTWIVTGVSLILAVLAVLGKGPLLFGVRMEPDPIALDIMRPQSKLLKPLIQFFCLISCILYFLVIIIRLRRSKGRRPVYLLPIGIGLFIWFLGGLHDGLRVAGVSVLCKEHILWLASFGLSIFLTIAIALHFQSLEQSVRKTKDVFERFVPPAYLRRIATEGLESICLGEADQQWVSVLCCDIRGFTALSERLNPSELVAFINRFLEQITPVINRWQGVIDKYLGDAVLCIFEGVDSAERAVACGVNILAAVRSFNIEQKGPTDPRVQVGIGIHTGPVILGTIGSYERMDSTVLGLTVNLSKRLEEATRPLGVDILITDKVANQLPNGHSYQFRKLGEVPLRGSLAPVGIVEVYDQDPPEIRNLKNLVKPLVAEGIELFKAGQHEAALSKFQEAKSIFPQDIPLSLLMTSLRHTWEQGQAIKGKALLQFG